MPDDHPKDGEVRTEATPVAVDILEQLRRQPRSIKVPSKTLEEAFRQSEDLLAQGRSDRANRLIQSLNQAMLTDPERADIYAELIRILEELIDRVNDLTRKIELTSSSSTDLPPSGVTLGQVVGARLAFLTVATVGLGTGGDDSAARDSSNSFTINWSGQLVADITLSGAGGLDAGVEAPNTWYAVHVIGDRTQVNPPAAMLSLSATAPVLPSGYNGFRRIGWVRNNAFSNFVAFTQHGRSRDRWYYITDNNSFDLFLGGATVFTPVSLAASMPPTSEEVQIGALFDQNNPAALYRLRPTGSTATAPRFLGTGGLVTAGNGIIDSFRMPTDSSQSIDYTLFLSGGSALTLWVMGYGDGI